MGALKWVADRCKDQLLPALQAASSETEIKEICEAEVAFWKSKFPGTPNSWRNPHTQSRKIVAASDLSEEKKAWVNEYLSLGKDLWTEINQSVVPALTLRLENQMLLKDPDNIVLQADALLDATRWQDLAAGLALATGRRSTEILKTATFSPATAWTVIFDGQLKNPVGPFEIPVLCPAEKVLTAYARLRAAFDVEDMTENEVSNSFHKPLTASVKRHFENLIPTRSGETLNTQDLRSVYQRLAIFFYAPLLVDAEEYAAEVAGHRKRGSKERSHGAGIHYSDYKIADQNGQIDGRQGVKLTDPDVKVLAVFESSHNGSTGLTTPQNGIVQMRPQSAMLTPEMLLSGEALELVKEGMRVANVTDFQGYLIAALKRHARNDLGIARRDTMANVEDMSMDGLVKARKHSTAIERIRRAVAAIASYNDSHVQSERWFISATLISYLIGGRFQTILDYLREHKTEVDNLNGKYNLNEKYNRKPDIKDVKEEVKTIIPVV